MSRTRRRLAYFHYRRGHTRTYHCMLFSGVKYYSHWFDPGDEKLLGQFRRYMIAPHQYRNWSRDYVNDRYSPDTYLYARIRQVHEEIVRNGSCRRHRINGTRMTKALNHRYGRRVLARDLREDLAEIYADIAAGVETALEVSDYLLCDHDYEQTPCSR